MAHLIINYFFIIGVHMINNDCIFNRQKLQDEYVRQVGTVFQQWESDLEKAKEQEEKLNVTKSIHLHHIIILYSITLPYSIFVSTVFKMQGCYWFYFCPCLLYLAVLCNHYCGSLFTCLIYSKVQ